MKRYLFTLPLILALVACEPAPPITQQQVQQSIAALPRTEIKLDSNLPGAKVSLAKNFYLVFDGSGSMADQCSGEEKLVGAKKAFHAFLTKVSKDANLGLYVFDASGSREVVPLGSGNHQKVSAAVDQIRSSGGTPLAEAIRTGTDRLVHQYKFQLGYGEYRLVVVTDGEADSLPEASLYAIQYRIPIYSIGLCIGDSHPLRRYALSYRAAENSDDLQRGLEETLAETPTFDVTFTQKR